MIIRQVVKDENLFSSFEGEKSLMADWIVEWPRAFEHISSHGSQHEESEKKQWNILPSISPQPSNWGQQPHLL